MAQTENLKLLTRNRRKKTTDDYPKTSRYRLETVTEQKILCYQNSNCAYTQTFVK